MLIFYLIVFIISGFVLYWSGEKLVDALIKIARYLKWREFVLAFFVISFAGCLPNLFLGINSALQKIPEFSLGDVLGGNVVDLTVAIALAVLATKRKEIPAQSRTVQTTSLFTLISALLPLLLMLDGQLSQIDGILLISLFFFYISWLFSKQERFTKVFNGEEINLSISEEIGILFKEIKTIFWGIVFLLIACEGIIISAKFFQNFVPLILLGILFAGLGNALPEIYFAISSAKKGNTWMILGSLMGSVVVTSTLVLGTVALFCPIKTTKLPLLAVARFFLLFSALFFFIFIRTDRKITKREAIILFLIYIFFLIACKINY